MITAFLPPVHQLLRRLGYVFLFLAALPLAAHAAKPKPAPAPAPAPSPVVTGPKYFFNIDLDPHYQFTGTGELTEEQAEHANCYRFNYTADGRLAQIEFLRAGKSAEDPALDVAQIAFEYAPGLERRWFRNPRGEAKMDDQGVYGEELTLNAAGYVTATTNLDDSGNHMRDENNVVQYVRTLDNQGRVIATRRIGLFGTAITDAAGYYERRWQYDEGGHVIDLGNYDDDGSLLNASNGVADIRTTYTIFPDSTQIIESCYDASGLPVADSSTGAHQCQQVLDKRGFLTDVSYFDSTGAPTDLERPGIGDSRFHERKLTIDDNGNLVTQEFFDVNGRPVGESGADIARIDYKYNAENLISEELFYGDDGKPQINREVGAAMVRQEYDAQGHIVHQMFFDGLGHPAPHALYLADAIRIKVDGETTAVSLFDDKDQHTKNPVNGYASFSYNSATDHPLSIFNKYYDLEGHQLSRIRVFVIFPHLHALRGNWAMKWSARLGALGVGLGAILGAFLALRKSSHTKRRKVFVPTPLERFLGWFSIFAILEGALRFSKTVYWWFIEYKNGRMGWGFDAVEAIFILFFIYRLYRMTQTMRVLNIEREDIHQLVRDFFAKAGLKAEWVEAHHRYLTPPLDVSVRYFRQKFHSYLAFACRGEKGKELQRELAAYIRAQTGGILGPVRTRLIALYYPSVAFCYLLLAGLAFYTLWQLVKGYS